MPEPDELERQIEALRELQPMPEGKTEAWRMLVKKIPLLTAFFRTVHMAHGPIETLLTMSNSTESLSPAGHTSPLFALILSAIDFIYLPALYLAFWMHKIKPPMDLTHWGRWLASTIILGSLIAALVIPGVAPTIAFVVAAVALSVSIATFVKTVIHHHRIKKALKNNVAEQQAQIDALYQWRNKVNQAKEQGGEFYEIQKKYFDEQLLIRTKVLQLLKNEEARLKSELKTKDTAALAYKAGMVILAALSVIGLALCPIFPFLGLSLFATASAVATVCLLGRMMIIGWNTWKERKTNESKKVEAPLEPIHESTNNINQMLLTSMPSLKNHLAELRSIHETKDEAKAHTFFKELSTAAHETQLSKAELLIFFKSSPDLQRLVNWYQSTSDSTKPDLYAPLKNILKPGP